MNFAKLSWNNIYYTYITVGIIKNDDPLRWNKITVSDVKVKRYELDLGDYGEYEDDRAVITNLYYAQLNIETKVAILKYLENTEYKNLTVKDLSIIDVGPQMSQEEYERKLKEAEE